MPTDDERREVARRLRELDDSELQVYDMTYFAIRSAVASEGDQYPDGRGLADRLADLIEPPYPDATASYRGWRADVYDPDGVLVSPSNVAADLVRTHANGKEPGIDREALLRLADEMDEVAQRRRSMGYEGFAIGDEDRARRIREALDVSDKRTTDATTC